MSEAAERAADAERRGATYWLLARLVLEPPSRPFVRELHAMLSSRSAEREEALADEVERLARTVGAAVNEAPAEVDLLVEHTRLWRGLSKQYGPPPPFESVFREQRLPGDATTAAAAAYAEASLDPEVADAGPADHMAIELRFMALCAVRAAQALRAGEAEEAERWAERQQRFLRDHLLAWAPAHCRSVAAEARTAYHRASALLIARACELDGEDLRHLA